MSENEFVQFTSQVPYIIFTGDFWRPWVPKGVTAVVELIFGDGGAFQRLSERALFAGNFLTAWSQARREGTDGSSDPSFRLLHSLTSPLDLNPRESIG